MESDQHQIQDQQSKAQMRGARRAEASVATCSVEVIG